MGLYKYWIIYLYPFYGLKMYVGIFKAVLETSKFDIQRTKCFLKSDIFDFSESCFLFHLNPQPDHFKSTLSRNLVKIRIHG